MQTSTRAVGTGSAGFNGDFGSDTALSLNQPSYVILDAAGNQYIADTGNNCVRKVDTSGNMTTLAGLVVSGQGDTCAATNPTPTVSQGLLRPAGLAVDSSNNLYIADAGHNCIRRLASGSVGTANLAVAAGTCSTTATLSSTPSPSGLAIDSSNNLYISLQDTESSPVPSTYQVVRQSVASVVLATNAATMCLVAGTPSLLVPTACSGITDSVVLSGPSGLAIDPNNNVVVADTGNNCVRQIVGMTTQTTLIGKCVNDGTTGVGTIHSPFGPAYSHINALFVSEASPNNVYRLLPGSSSLLLVAGYPAGNSGTYISAQDGVSAQNIPLNSPKGLAFDPNNNFYLVDSGNSIVRYLNVNYIFPNTAVNHSSAAQPITYIINTASKLTVTAGPDYTITSNTCNGTQTPTAVGAPPRTCQVFVQFAPTRPGTRYSALQITDSISGTLVSTGLQSIGTGSLGVFAPGTVNTIASKLNAPSAVATDSAGNAYILENGTTPGTADVRIITPGGSTSTLAIKAGAGLVTPTGLAADAAGNWYIVDSAQGNITRFGADGSVNASYVTGLVSPSALYVDGFGNLYVAQQGTAHNVIEIYNSGSRRVVAGSGTDTAANNVLATTAKFVAPDGLFIDLNGVLYIADSGSHRVFAVDNANLIHLLAGNGTTTTTTAGVALGTGLVSPSSIAVDAAGDVYIADPGANRVYVIYATSASGTNIATTLGTGVAGYSGDGGYSISAQVNGPLSVALDSSGNLFVVDAGNSAVREITYPSPTINFDSVAVNTTSAVKAQYFSNTGTVGLNLLAAIGTTDSHFAVDSATTTCGITILPGQVCAIGYKFTPSATTAYTASSVLSSDAYDSPQTVTLKGNGTLALPVNSSGSTESEVYGSPFPETSTFTTGSGPAVTGTLTYMTSTGQVLCTTPAGGTLSPSSTCNAANSGLPVGSYTIIVTYSGDSNYTPTTYMVTLNVTPAPLKVTVNNATRAYGAANPTFTGTVTGVVNGDTILTAYSTTATAASAPGSYPINTTLTAVAPASLSNYTVTTVPGTLLITQAVLTATVLNASRVYGQPNPTFTSTLSGNIAGDVFTYNYSTTATTTSPVGTYPITLTLSGAAALNYTITVIPGTLTVTPAPLSVTVASATRPYGVANPTFVRQSISGAVNGDTFIDNFSTTATVTSPVGTYPINDTLSGAAASNYTITVTPGTLTITKATLGVTVTVNNATKVYGAPLPTFTSTTVGTVNGDTFTITYSTTATASSPIGTYTITLTVGGAAAANYNITTSNGTLTITPAPLSVVANSFTRSYGSANPTLTGTITGVVNGDTITPSYTTTAMVTTGVGTYPIVASATGAALSNYTLTTTNGTLTITQAALAVTIMPNNATRIYGAPNPTLTGVVTGGLNGDVLTATLTTTATVTSPIGLYPITAMLSGPAAANYTATVTPANLTVTPAPTATALVLSASQISNGSSVTMTATVTTSVSTTVGLPTGTMTFYDGTNVLGSGPVNGSGVAIFSTSTLTPGNHTIMATFVPASTNFLGSSNTAPEAILGNIGLSATPQTQIIRGAGATVYQVTVSSLNGFVGPVVLVCSGFPTDGACNFSSSTVTLTASQSQTVQMTVTNTVNDAQMKKPALPGSSDHPTILSASMLPIELGGLIFGLISLGRRRKTVLQARLLLLLVFSLGIGVLTGCGCPNSTSRTYNINITGVSTAGLAPTVSTTVELTVGLNN